MNLRPLEPTRLEPHRFYADTVADRIEAQIAEASQALGEDEMLVAIVPLADGTRIAVNSIGYHNPSLIVVYGQDRNAEEAILLLSHTNVQMILRKVKRQPEQPKNVIGFLGSVSPGEPSE